MASSIFSTAEQVIGSCRKHRAGEKDLHLGQVSTAPLGDALKWEPARGGQLFPHLFQPLPMALVEAIAELEMDDNGDHIFPVLPLTDR